MENKTKTKLSDDFTPYGLFDSYLVPHAISKLKTISSSAKLCWGRLKEYAGKDGLCFPYTGTT